jgi:hypothetical protein
MLTHCERPMVFPPLNPTANCEALPEDIFRWSQGRAIVATGSPFKDVHHEGRIIASVRATTSSSSPAWGWRPSSARSAR